MKSPKLLRMILSREHMCILIFHIANDDLQHGWCQRIKTEFTFEYNYLEDELLV